MAFDLNSRLEYFVAEWHRIYGEKSLLVGFDHELSQCFFEAEFTTAELFKLNFSSEVFNDFCKKFGVEGFLLFVGKEQLVSLRIYFRDKNYNFHKEE